MPATPGTTPVIVSAKAALDQAAAEEIDHLAWTERRIAELGGRRSWPGRQR
jgi:demethoxyubiquinone hydroxylase (CLK1/Coq7/Cat5 family)